MEMLEINCAGCGKIIVIDEEYIREQMFCTLGCMDLYEENCI